MFVGLDASGNERTTSEPSHTIPGSAESCTALGAVGACSSLGDYVGNLLSRLKETRKATNTQFSKFKFKDEDINEVEEALESLSHKYCTYYIGAVHSISSLFFVATEMAAVNEEPMRPSFQRAQMRHILYSSLLCCHKNAVFRI